MATINRTELGPPNHELIKERPTEKLIRKENLTDLLRKPRDISGTLSGFGSKLPRHEPTHDKRFFGTTYGHFFGKPIKSTATNIMNTFRATSSIPAGREPVTTHMNRNHVLMAGEILRKDGDPQKDTEAQRSWICKVDPCIEAAQRGQTQRLLPKYDNALSLPLGEGEHAEMPIMSAPGSYRRMRMDVTLGPSWKCSSRFK